MNMLREMALSHLSREFFDFVRSIGESKSKQEEDRIITAVIVSLKSKFHQTQRPLTKEEIRECLIKLIYIEMLGHDGSFAYVQAIQLTASENILQKRVGYLCSGLCLSPAHDFRFMLVNQLQRDLKSANVLEVSAALSALCKLVTVDMIPAVIGPLYQTLTSEQPAIQRRGIMALHRVLLLFPSVFDSYGTSKVGVHETIFDALIGFLSGTELSVISTVITLFHVVLVSKSKALQTTRMKLFSLDLVRMYIRLLKQIVDHNVEPGYLYHHVPAPWVQIKLLKSLAVLGQENEEFSTQMYAVLADNMRRLKALSSPMGFSLLYETIKTVCAIVERKELLDLAAQSTSVFLNSTNCNLKYLGVHALGLLVERNIAYAGQHQMTVLDCLESDDDTLKRKTVELLYKMTNPSNAEFVIERLISFLAQVKDSFLRKTLVARIIGLSEKFSPSAVWYCRNFFKVLLIAGDLVDESTLNLFLHFIEENSEASEEDVRKEAFNLSIQVLQKLMDNDTGQIACQEVILRTIIFCIGEFYVAEMGGTNDVKAIDDLLHYIVNETISPQNRAMFCTALVKMIQRYEPLRIAIGKEHAIDEQPGSLRKALFTFLHQGSMSVDCDFQQRCHELRVLVTDLEASHGSTPSRILSTTTTLPWLGSEIDLTFLEAYTSLFQQQQLVKVVEELKVQDYYLDAEATLQDDAGLRSTVVQNPYAELRYDAYEEPKPITAFSADPAQTQPFENNARYTEDTEARQLATDSTQQATGLKMAKVKQVWGSQGYNRSSFLERSTEAGKPHSAELPVAAAKALDFTGLSLKQPSSQAPLPNVPGIQREDRVAKTAELSDREKLAAALFGGDRSLSSNAGTQGANLFKNSQRNGERKKASGPVKQPVTTSEEADLLGFDFEEEEEMASKAPAQPASLSTKVSTSFDFLSSTKVSSGPEDLNLSPLQLRIDEVSTRWAELLCEKRVSFDRPGSGTFVEIVKAIQKESDLNPVEVIEGSQEAIFAGQVDAGLDLFDATLSGFDSKSALFVHLRQKDSEQASTFNLIIKSNDDQLNLRVAQMLMRLL